MLLLSRQGYRGCVTAAHSSGETYRQLLRALLQALLMGTVVLQVPTVLAALHHLGRHLHCWLPWACLLALAVLVLLLLGPVAAGQALPCEQQAI
jgi:hypothetical protein